MPVGRIGEAKFPVAIKSRELTGEVSPVFDRALTLKLRPRRSGHYQPSMLGAFEFQLTRLGSALCFSGRSRLAGKQNTI
jgi:hypothetical protein